MAFAIRHSPLAFAFQDTRNQAMRILVVGAGAIGGYFRRQDAEGGRDVTFLVRPAGPPNWLPPASSSRARTATSPEESADGAGRRAERKIRRRAVELQGVRPRGRDQIFRAGGRRQRPRSFRCSTACCISTCSTPKFGRERVLGGLCAIAVTLNDKREVVHFQPMLLHRYEQHDISPPDPRNPHRHHQSSHGHDHPYLWHEETHIRGDRSDGRKTC